MGITVGRQLGSYEITALIGEGGMGRVFKARDIDRSDNVYIADSTPTTTASASFVAESRRL